MVLVINLIRAFPFTFNIAIDYGFFCFFIEFAFNVPQTLQITLHVVVSDEQRYFPFTRLSNTPPPTYCPSQECLYSIRLTSDLYRGEVRMFSNF